MKTLYVNAAVRSGSRTAELAREVLGHLGGDVTEIRPHECGFPVADEGFLAKRDKACAAGDLSGEMFSAARQFAQADTIVIAAPFWDLSFPAALKQYFEQINVVGLTFTYRDGRPVSLCRAKRLFYVTTAGGRIFSAEYGFGYVRALAESFYGIGECVMFSAERLDEYGFDADAAMEQAKHEIGGYFSRQG